MEKSILQTFRAEYKPKMPDILKSNFNSILIEKTKAKELSKEVSDAFPNTKANEALQCKSAEKPIEKEFKEMHIGVVLSGGQAAGGHNVIVALFDAMKKANSKSILYGFLGGPSGLIDGKYITIDDNLINDYRNTGGFDIIGSGRTKIQSEEQIKSSIEVAKSLSLDGLLIVGGDDSNTNAAFLAEHFLKAGLKTSVIGVPKTIDGDLKNEYIELSFGFDTATKTYSELIGNIARDATSAKKYWHFIKLMGRSASHIALECALKTHPNICLISEEVTAKQKTLNQVVEEIVDVIVKRSEKKEDFGIVLIPEGLIEFIPEMQDLIASLNEILSKMKDNDANEGSIEAKITMITSHLSPSQLELFNSLPSDVSKQLLLDRDPHGNVQVSRIETEKLLIYMVEKALKKLKEEGKYNGKFSSYSHFFGYEGRSAFPSNFDCDYCYTLGHTAFILMQEKYTGYIVSVQNLKQPVSEWKVGGTPLVSMLHVERRSGKDNLVIQKALVDLQGSSFKTWKEINEKGKYSSSYKYPGAIQYAGPQELTESVPMTLSLQ